MIEVPLLELGMCGFDTESTGTDPLKDQIVTAGMVYMGSDGRSVRLNRSCLINCERDSSEEAVRVHGVTNDRKARDGMPSSEAIPKIARTLRNMFRRGVPVVIYNAPFDLTLLDAELARLGEKPLFDGVKSPVIIDPLVIDKALDKYRRGSRKLVDTAKLFGITLNDAHDANSDAIAACGVAAELFRRNPSIVGISGATLMRQQQDWFREQQEGYEKWRRSNGDSSFRTSKAWPVRSVVEYAK